MPEQTRQLDWHSILLFMVALSSKSSSDQGEKNGNLRENGLEKGLGGPHFQADFDNLPDSASNGLRADLRWMAGKLAELELTNVQIGLMAALLAFQRVEVRKIQLNIYNYYFSSDVIKIGKFPR